jgi:hypothetical protein
VQFVPNVKRGRHEGKQIYLLAGFSIYLDGGVCWAEVNGKWKPTSLDELLARKK